MLSRASANASSFRGVKERNVDRDKRGRSGRVG